MRDRWRPFSSASEDGIPVLAYWDKSNVYGVIIYERDAWREEETGDEVRGATHWQPLEPPSADGSVP